MIYVNMIPIQQMRLRMLSFEHMHAGVHVLRPMNKLEYNWRLNGKTIKHL